MLPLAPSKKGVTFLDQSADDNSKLTNTETTPRIPGKQQRQPGWAGELQGLWVWKKRMQGASSLFPVLAEGRQRHH
jgi:hypothetical protein